MKRNTLILENPYKKTHGCVPFELHFPTIQVTDVAKISDAGP